MFYLTRHLTLFCALSWIQGVLMSRPIVRNEGFDSRLNRHEHPGFHHGYGSCDDKNDALRKLSSTGNVMYQDMCQGFQSDASACMECYMGTLKSNGMVDDYDVATYPFDITASTPTPSSKANPSGRAKKIKNKSSESPSISPSPTKPTNGTAGNSTVTITNAPRTTTVLGKRVSTTRTTTGTDASAKQALQSCFSQYPLPSLYDPCVQQLQDGSDPLILPSESLLGRRCQSQSSEDRVVRSHVCLQLFTLGEKCLNETVNSFIDGNYPDSPVKAMLSSVSCIIKGTRAMTLSSYRYSRRNMFNTYNNAPGYA